MQNHRTSRLARRRALLGLALGWPLASSAQNANELLDYAPRAKPPPGYDPAYAGVVRAAEDEGQLVIYATTDADVVRPLLADFQAMYPRVRVEYDDLTSTELYHRYLAETQLGTESADVLWSSAMDLQASLARRGYAMAYASPEASALPAWARWQDQGWATSIDPVAIAYNRKLLRPAQVPRTHADLAKLLATQASQLRRKVITYDIEKSGLGFLLATQDAAAGPAMWDIATALGKLDTRYVSTTAAMLRQVANGSMALAYNVLGAYALGQAQKNPAIGVAFLNDYTLVLSRIQLISQRTRHPNAARLWIDYTLSRRGQTLMAQRAGLYAVRSDVGGATTTARLVTQLGTSMRPILNDADLTRHLDIAAYREFVTRWRTATGQK
jgi:iron(III) transport system substrate-binding protein